MKVSPEKFLDEIKAFVRDEIAPKLTDETSRFALGVLLNLTTPETAVPFAEQMFPQVARFLPVVKDAGIFRDGQIDVSRLEQAFISGFALAGNSLTIPVSASGEKEISVKITPATWEVFKSRLATA